MTTSYLAEARTLDVSLTRPTMQTIESTFSAGVLSTDVREALHGLGLDLPDAAYVNLVTRAAPMGPVPADVVVATFYNLNPKLTEGLFPEIWAKASPERILSTQRDAFSPVLAAALAPVDASELGELAELARTAAQAAARNREGRPLFAGLASLPWPREDHLVIWHAAKMLREHRGDGHIATLVVEGLSGIEALAVHAPYEGWPAEALRDSRRWDPGSWDACLAGLRRRGWLTQDDKPTLTEEGRRRRRWIEDRTDELAAVAYEPLGAEGMARMRELGTKVQTALQAARLAPIRSSRSNQ